MACDVLDKANQSTGNDKGERRYKYGSIRSRYAKYVFLPGKINSVIVSLVLLGLFTDRNDAFCYPFFIPEA